MRHCSTPVIQTVVQLPSPQRVEKCRVIFERTPSSAPHYLWVRVCLRVSCNQDVKAVIDSAALVMHDVIITPYGCPNQALPWDRWVRDGISHVPLLAWLCELAVFAGTKRDNSGWQIAGRMNLMKARGILQDFAILRWKLRDLCVADALNRDGEEQLTADLFHAQPNETEISHGRVSWQAR
jgi:hypothetical protein